MRFPAPIRNGLDVLAGEPARLAGRRLGLVVNPASVTSRLVPAADALRDAGLDVARLFGPEHGLTGAAQDMVPVGTEDAPNPELSKLSTPPTPSTPSTFSTPPVVSLYGNTVEELSPRPEHLHGLDTVVCDLPDVGSRYYTFVWTTALVMKACAARGLPVVVLDRPNPLGGSTVEGNLPEERLLSFVGLYPVPVRHGMTPGEIARFVNGEFALGCDLTVIPMEVAGRKGPLPRERAGECPAWVLPSPNMPTPGTALVYPGSCLFEGTNLSEGRGTTRPFELVGAPWIDPARAAGAANALGLPGVRFRPHVFRPTFHKHAGEDCGGVQVHVTDPATFRSFETGLRLLQVLRDLDPARFRWRTETYEYRDDVPAIDLLAGTARLRELVDRGEPLDRWIGSFAADVARFAPVRSRHLVYEPGSAGKEAPVLPPHVMVVGAHESGKTTLAVKLIAALVARGLRVGSIKHTGHAYETDASGKDSQRHAAAGASPAILVAGPRTAVHRAHDDAAPRLLDLVSRDLRGVDVVVVEGFRDERGPKVEVVRAATGRPPVSLLDPELLAVVADRETAHPASVPRLPLDDLAAVLALVLPALGLGERR